MSDRSVPSSRARREFLRKSAFAGAAAGLPTVLVALRAAERQILETVTLADVVEDRLPARVRKLTDDPAAWR